VQASFLKQALDTLGKSHFNRSWPDDSVKLLGMEVVDIPDKAMLEVVKRIRLEISPSTFPALSRIKDMLQEEQKNINLANSPAEPMSRRDNDASFQQSKFGDKATEYHTRASKFCIKIANGELTHDQIIRTCEQFEKSYPGVGWKETELYFVKMYREQ